MSASQSVLEMGIHVLTKFTGSAGEHIVDESVENQNERFDLCSDLARRDPNDHIHEEYENDSSVDLSGWKRERPPFYKSVLQCSFIVFRNVLLIGSYFGVTGNLLVFVILNIMFQDFSLCDLIREQNLVLAGTIGLLPKVKMGLVVASVFFLDHFMVLLLCTVFTWSAVRRSRILVVNTLSTITDIWYRVVLKALNKYRAPFLPYPIYVLYIITMLHHCYAMGRKVFPESRTAALNVATKLCVHLIATVITTNIMLYTTFPWFLTLHGVPKLLVATFAPLIFLPCKLLGRLCVLRLQGVLHPSTSFALLSVIYAIESTLARAMQADLAGFKLFVIYGVFHGIVHVAETIVITTLDSWSKVIRSIYSNKKGYTVKTRFSPFLICD